MRTISEQLKAACEAAGFTQTDMAVWLGYDYSTVHTWIVHGVTPLPPKQWHIKVRLELLYSVLRKSGGVLFPVPPEVNQYERRAYIEGIRDSALNRISKPGASG